MSRIRVGGALFLAMLSVSGSVAADWSQTFSASASWDDNVSNSDRSSDEIGALRLLGDYGASRRIALGGADTFFVGAHLSFESWPRFDGLDRAQLGPQLTWQHKFGLGPMAPVLRVEFAGEGVVARESIRAGLAGSAAAVWSQRLDESTRFSLRYERARHDASNPVFDRTGGEASFTLSRDLDDRWRVAVTGRWREGDVVSYATPPRPDIVAIARVRTDVATFGQPRVAYSIDARTLGGSFGISRLLDEATSLTFGYDYRRSKHTSLAYVNQLVSLALDRQF